MRLLLEDAPHPSTQCYGTDLPLSEIGIEGGIDGTGIQWCVRLIGSAMSAHSTSLHRVSQVLASGDLLLVDDCV